MRSAHSTPVATGPALTGAGVATLVGLGAAATAVGGLGVGFRAAGFGYLGQSLVVLTMGVAMLFGGLRIAAHVRRETFASLRPAPAPVPRRLAAVRTSPVATRPQPFAPDPRMRVHAWIAPPLELPPASAA